MNTPAEEIRARIVNKRLCINRVPEKAYEQFVELANSEFVGDYGMALKYLLDVYYGIVPKGWERLELKIDLFEERLQKLEGSTGSDKPNPDRKVRKMLDGKVRG